MKLKIVHVDLELSKQQKVAIASALVMANDGAARSHRDGERAQHVRRQRGADRRCAQCEFRRPRGPTRRASITIRRLFDGRRYCGATDPTTGELADLSASGTGYVKAKGAREATCGAPTAHMCNGAELSRTAQLDQAPTSRVGTRPARLSNAPRPWGAICAATDVRRRADADRRPCSMRASRAAPCRRGSSRRRIGADWARGERSGGRAA